MILHFQKNLKIERSKQGKKLLRRPIQKKKEEPTGNILKIKLKRDDNKYEHQNMQKLEGIELGLAVQEKSREAVMEDPQMVTSLRKVN